MAAPPVKSQPLHNFSLPHLKWAQKTISSASGSSSHHHRFRRRDSPDQHRHRNPDLESYPETQPTNPKPQPPAPRNDSVLTAVEEENGEAKPWKLRPRKEVIRPASTSKKETGAENNDNNKINSNSNGVKSQRLRGLVEGGQQNGGVERKKKRKVWISLSREEIEEDVYALTGGKPPRRPKKWPKNVQKQLEGVFPGLYLVGVAADSYRVMML
ncbi:hypothetical protein CDL12_27397 [Handroanthus impetiginosus]|uniref:Uncharacterized protein n=1 Tax=Handroanthus impetiginosus TaxID=429701 RepID=A0A2G9G477_9LAMI|nr:hypothetical protein CDL12_27397 [Handroanthus impetiginosus]